MDDFTVAYRQLPRTTLLSSKEDLANDSWQSTLGNGRSLWTNWRCTNFLLSYQLPLRSKGRPGYRRNLELIHMGLCEPRVAKSLVDFLCPFVFPKKNATRQFLSGARHSVLLRRLSLLTASPRVTCLMKGVALLSLLLGPIYIVHSLSYPSPFS